MTDQNRDLGEGYPRYVLRLTARQYEMGPFGHINYAVYLNYLEQAAAEHHASIGLTVDRFGAIGGGFAVRDVELHYQGAAVMGDELIITTWLESCSGVRAVRCSEIRHAVTDKTLVTARVVWVWVNLQNGRPQRIPHDVMNCICPTIAETKEADHAPVL